MTVTATVQGDTTWATSKVVKVVVGSGTATEGTDFKTVDDFDITIPAGSSSATGTFTLDPEDDDIDEGTGETVEITGSTSASDTVDGTEVTIEDDDKAPTGIALSATVPDNGGTTDTLSEDDDAQTVTVTATVQGDTTWATSKVVKVVVGSGTATEGTDFKTVDDFDITIPAGSSSATGSFTLDPEDDDIDEGTGETVEITGSTSASDTVDGTEVTIEDDDKAPTGIALSATVPDNGGTTDTTFRGRRRTNGDGDGDGAGRHDLGHVQGCEGGRWLGDGDGGDGLQDGGRLRHHDSGRVFERDGNVHVGPGR